MYTSICLSYPWSLAWLNLEVYMPKEKRSSVSLSRTTKDALDSIKHAGQSYDGLIRELLRFRNEQRGARLK